MSLNITMTAELDGTLRYECSQDIVVRVQLHRANGRKKCPVELLYQDTSILATDANLRELRDIESLNKHALTLCNSVLWHEVLTAVAKDLPDKAQAPWTPVSKPLASYTVERKHYYWYPLLPKGEPVSLEGDPGTGKSALLVKLICHLTTGQRFPTLFPDRPEQDFPPRNVLLFTYEDDPNSTIHPRVVINSGDPQRVQFVEGKRDPETGEVRPITLQDLALLETLLQTYDPALMAFDPLQSFFGEHADMNNATDTRPILDAVRNLCKRYGCTPLFIRHNGKAQRSKAMHAALGSVDIVANLRSAMALYKDPDDDTRRILAHTKTNGRTAPSMQLKLTGVTHDVMLDARTIVTVEDVKVDWDGKSDLTADDLNARESAHGNDSEEAQSALDQAREFLRKILQDGPVLVDDIKAQARKAGVTEKTLRRAKDKEKVKARRQEQDGVPHSKCPWIWELPGTGGMAI
jgi:RecA-family ATPase